MDVGGWLRGAGHVGGHAGEGCVEAFGAAAGFEVGVVVVAELVVERVAAGGSTAAEGTFRVCEGVGCEASFGVGVAEVFDPARERSASPCEAGSASLYVVRRIFFVGALLVGLDFCVLLEIA